MEVEEDVDAAELLLHGGEESGDVGLVGDIDDGGDDIGGAEFAGLVGEFGEGAEAGG